MTTESQRAIVANVEDFLKTYSIIGSTFVSKANNAENVQQDGRLAPAYFLPNDKFFDELLQKVKNETYVLKSVFKVFFTTNINSTADFDTLRKRVSRFSVEIFLPHSAKKICR